MIGYPGTRSYRRWFEEKAAACLHNLTQELEHLGAKKVVTEGGTSWDVLGEYTDVTVATTDEGTNLNLGPLATSSNNYYYYAILITRIEKIKQDANNVAIRWLRYYSTPNSCVSFQQCDAPTASPGCVRNKVPHLTSTLSAV